MPDQGHILPTASGSTLLESSRQRTRKVAIVGAVAVISGAAWVLLAPAAKPISAPTFDLAAKEDATTQPPLEIVAFQTPVWTIALPEAPKEAAAPPPPPPPPLKVQLIGIMKEGDLYKAVLYDPDTNKVRVVETGDDVQGRRVELVAMDNVRIRNGASTQTLVLKNQGGTP